MTPSYRRRDVLIGAGTLAGSLALPRLTARAESTKLPRRRLFFADPDYAALELSPDGSKLAFLAPLDGVRNLWLAPVDDISAARPLTRATERSIGGFFRWAYDGRHIVFFEDRDGDENWRASSVDVASGATLPLTPERGVRAWLYEASRHFPREMLIAHNERDKRHLDVYRVDVATGAKRLVLENHQFAWLVTDSALRVRLGTRVAEDGSIDFLSQRADGSWIHFTKVPRADFDTTQAVDISDEGRTLYMVDSRERDRAALVAIDMESGHERLLAAAADGEVTGALLHPVTRRPRAVSIYADRQHWRALDPAAATMLSALSRHDSGDLSFVSSSADARFYTAFYEHDAASGAYVLYDAKTMRVRPLVEQRPRLSDVKLQPLKPVRFNARDGLPLNGYLTLPARGMRGLPVVLLVHGGPYARDRWGYSPTHQWLASRGYAVLSVNYRGSTGYGKAFVTAADHEWGGKMHDDLIDAVHWAIERGIADPKRVGFFGGSYGGYSALTALTRTPDVFACIVDLFGISNLVTFMATIPPYWQPWFNLWYQRLADPHTEAGRAFLIERSPIAHITEARRPILIAQGLQDVRVVPAESEQMVRALRERNVPVTYITFRDEGHGFVREPNRIAFNAVAEGFLAKHLGGASEPIGDDFAGSSFVVETGAELIPGLAEATAR